MAIESDRLARRAVVKLFAWFWRPESPRYEDDLGTAALLWISLPLGVWAGFGINSLIVGFTSAGRSAMWLSIWGVACTATCAAAISHGIGIARSQRRERKEPS